MIRDMTRGNVTRHLVGFSVPIILGNLFQLAYNAVDSIVVGRFAGTGALAAVGTANPVMNIIILGVSGLCIGASVLMSEYFGARDTEKLRREFAATLFLGMFFSAAVLALGLPLAGPLLRLLNVPDEIFPQARAYLCIIFLGMPFTFVYNAYAAAMRSGRFPHAHPFSGAGIGAQRRIGRGVCGRPALGCGGRGNCHRPRRKPFCNFMCYLYRA